MGLDENIGCDAASACSGTTFIGDWWITEGFFYLDATFDWDGDRDKSKDTWFYIDFVTDNN